MCVGGGGGHPWGEGGHQWAYLGIICALTQRLPSLLIACVCACECKKSRKTKLYCCIIQL